MTKSIPVRFEDETVELLQFVSGPLYEGYGTQADFIRLAVEEKLKREQVREQYEVARRALAEAKKLSPANQVLTRREFAPA